MNVALSVPVFQSALPLPQRAVIMACVVVAHAVVLAQPWLAAPGLSAPAARELSVSLAGAQAPRHAVPQKRAIEHKTQSTVAEPQPAAAEPAHAEPAQAAAPGLPDLEPDYRAAYLNNPQPGYPLAARRMGWQGKVVIEVEVLADGTPGEVIVQQSSGREVLDDAALRAVRGWRFVPARVGGIAVTKRFQIPIAFNLT
ncbi:MAG TPA: energy transducer TonB [Gallionella sp.]